VRCFNEIISDFCKVSSLSDSNIVLMDIDKTRVENVLVLAKELSQYFGAKLTFEIADTIKVLLKVPTLL